MPHERQHLIRSLFDEYIDMYSSRDERLLSRFSDNFSGYAGSSDILVTNKEEFDYHRPSAYELYSRIQVRSATLSNLSG